jgi:hypothetical protein
MEFFGNKKSNLLTITIFVVSVIVSGLLFVPFLQLEQLMMTRMHRITYDDVDSNHDTAINYFHAAFAYHGKEISEKLNYAHFLPLGSGSNISNQSRQVNQVKVIVNYTVMEPSSVNKQNMTALMRVYASNGTLIKSSPAKLGFIGNNTNNTTTTTGGQSELATAITDSRVKDVRAFVFFTNAERNGNFSSPVNVNLTLGQRIPK